jgi:hypothetical protein
MFAGNDTRPAWGLVGDPGAVEELLVESACAAVSLSHRPGNRRIGHAGYDYLAADKAAHALADAESGRSLLAE